MPADPAIQAGASQIVRRCLGLEPEQQLVILMDETTAEPAVAIAEAAERLGVPHTAILVPVAVQRRIPHHGDLSLATQGAVREARGILTCLTAAPDCLPFRERFLETYWTARTRIGHMPGASLEVLRLADVDYEQLVADCHNLEVALARGQKLELISHEPNGKRHCLQADLGGWERLPVASDGVIADGAWGNVPSGETYIAPMEGTAAGSVVIDGSIPGLVVPAGQALVLHFEAGRLLRLGPEGSPTAAFLEDTQIRQAKAAGDLRWSHLAEIGLGTNLAVTHLTGNMLLDEKAAGTAHVAIGSNIFMGGTLDAAIHCDMVIRRPTVLVDGKVILDQGKLRYVAAEWHESHEQVALNASPWRAYSQVTRSGIQAGCAPDGRLQRVLRSEPGRVSACSVGESDTARLAQTLYALVPDGGEWLPVDRLASRAGLPAKLARRVLHVMSLYDLVLGS